MTAVDTSLPGTPLPRPDWDAQALQRQLRAWLALVPEGPVRDGLVVEVLPATESTNTALLERARAGDARPCLLVAEQQTRGRGRLGRGWVSSAGASLTFSLALPLAPARWEGLSLAVGLALAEALDEAVPPRLQLKWPNDLWLLDGPGRGRKLGGILIETSHLGTARLCVVGVGLNLLPQQGLPELAQGYACLQELDAGAVLSGPAVLARVALPLLQALLRFEAGGFAPLVAAYARRDLLRGHAVRTTWPALPDGVAEGVDAEGALRVRAGALHRIVSGEVSVRLHTETA
jgi:BirA family biotin operon repressor/biotin-[acetyl-CoA-carboxylase] ligase